MQFVRNHTGAVENIPRFSVCDDRFIWKTGFPVATVWWFIIVNVCIYVIVRVHLSLAALAPIGLLIARTLHKCILIMLVYNLCLDRQCNIYVHRNMSIHRSIGCFHEIEIQTYTAFLLSDTYRLDTNTRYTREQSVINYTIFWRCCNITLQQQLFYVAYNW